MMVGREALSQVRRARSQRRGILRGTVQTEIAGVAPKESWREEVEALRAMENRTTHRAIAAGLAAAAVRTDRDGDVVTLAGPAGAHEEPFRPPRAWRVVAQKLFRVVAAVRRQLERIPCRESHRLVVSV